MSQSRAVRHVRLRNESLITTYGTAIIDGEGYVTNMDDLKCTREQLAALPNMIDTSVFVPTKASATPAQVQKPLQAPKSDGPTDAEIYSLIKELTAKGAKLNSEGYIDMDALSPEIKQRGWPTLSGSRRIKITDEGRAAEAKTDSLTQTDGTTKPTGDMVIDPNAPASQTGDEKKSE